MRLYKTTDPEIYNIHAVFDCSDIKLSASLKEKSLWMTHNKPVENLSIDYVPMLDANEHDVIETFNSYYKFVSENYSCEKVSFERLNEIYNSHKKRFHEPVKTGAIMCNSKTTQYVHIKSHIITNNKLDDFKVIMMPDPEYFSVFEFEVNNKDEILKFGLVSKLDEIKILQLDFFN